MKSWPPRKKAPMSGEKVSYLMLFCTLILVRNAKASLEESLAVVPLGGNAKSLASYLGR